jgi:hypothetical protein
MAGTRYTIKGQTQWKLIEMLESPAYMVLSLSAHRVIDRISIEMAHHGGQDNGVLPVTYDDFVAYGIDRHAVAPAIREAEALGFIEVTERGRASAGEFRSPNKFRITFQPILKRNRATIEPTNDWRGIKTIEGAQVLAKAARKTPAEQSHRPPRSRPALRAVTTI